MNFAAYDDCYETGSNRSKIVYKPSIKILVKGLDGIDATQGKVKQAHRELCSPAD